MNKFMIYVLGFISVIFFPTQGESQCDTLCKLSGFHLHIM